jgi:hypothetical protein
MPIKKLHLTTNIGDTKQDATLSLSICNSIVAAQWKINKLLDKRYKYGKSLRYTSEAFLL